ncbi:MAG: iron-containing alcohol dehydrogenase [Synergistaceae bacterium]|nr:iron-containing alcohol dehydrogenase [Synergistaceae bacterium]
MRIYTYCWGGSSIDVAKYVKLNNPEAKLAVIPTTAGSGSEATRFAVLYEDGKKLSITDDIMIPDYVLFDPELLKYLSDYHRKSSALDALSHALESFWSVNADSESQNFSREALTNITRLLENYPESYKPEEMLMSSYKAGRAINISQTTAGHAMCYKLTGLFKIAHGHAAALCNRILFRWLVNNKPLLVLNNIADSMSCKSPEEAAEKFCAIFDKLGLEPPRASSHDIEILAESVNPERLKNFPAELDKITIKNLYQEILNTNGR